MVGLRALALAVAALAAFTIIGATSGVTASNTLPTTFVSQTNITINAEALKPSSCSAITLTTTIVGVTGGANPDLVLGTAAGESLDGNGGDDCILGGGGNDSIRGRAGNDVCIGGPGTDTFNADCETQIQ